MVSIRYLLEVAELWCRKRSPEDSVASTKVTGELFSFESVCSERQGASVRVPSSSALWKTERLKVGHSTRGLIGTSVLQFRGFHQLGKMVQTELGPGFQPFAPQAKLLQSEELQSRDAGLTLGNVLLAKLA